MNKIDEYLNSIDTKQKVMIAISFVLCLFFVLNQVVPPMIEKRDELNYSINDLEMKISKNCLKRLKREERALKKKLLAKKEEVNKKRENVDFIVSNLYKIRYAFFNDLKWAKILDEILAYSLKRDIKIVSLKNFDVQDGSKQTIKHKKNIKITGIGSYKNIVLFIKNFLVLIFLLN